MRRKGHPTAEGGMEDVHLAGTRPRAQGVFEFVFVFVLVFFVIVLCLCLCCGL